MAARSEEAPELSVRRARRGQLVAVVLGVLLGAAVVWSLLRPGVGPAPSSTVHRLSVMLPEGTELAFARFAPRGLGRPSIALSPDGRRLAYVARTGDTVRLYLRALDASEAKPLPGTEGAFNPFFSPEGTWIAFFAERALKKISVLGGQPVVLCEALHPHGGTWGADDTIVVSGYGARDLWRVPAHGGQQEVEVLVRNFSLGWFWPSFLPEGQAVLFSGRRQIGVRLLDAGEEEVVVEEGGSCVKYLPTGHLVFARGGALMAAPFDLDDLRVTGDAVPVMDGLRVEARGAAQYAVSRNGTLAYVPGESMEEGRLVWRDRGKDARPVEAWPGYRRYGMFRLSPDGKDLAVRIPGPGDHIWIYHLERGGQDRLTHVGINTYPIWTIDGERVVYCSRREEVEGLFTRQIDGSSAAELIIRGSALSPASFSKDGQVLLIADQSETPTSGLSAVFLDTRERKALTKRPFYDWGPRFSPDGKWIVYTREAVGSSEVYVQSYPDPGTMTKISVNGGEEPIWSPKGDEIFYRNLDRWMVVPVTLEPEFKTDKPRELFKGNYLNTPGMSYDYDPHRDRFLLIEPHPEDPSREIRIVLNWFEELQRLLAAGAE